MLIEPEGRRDVTLIGTGSEVSLAITAAKALQGGDRSRGGVDALLGLFAGQDQGYQDAVLGTAPALASRPLISDGRNGLDRKASSSECVDLGLQLRARSFIRLRITAVAVEAAAHHLIGKSKSEETCRISASPSTDWEDRQAYASGLPRSAP